MKKINRIKELEKYKNLIENITITIEFNIHQQIPELQMKADIYDTSASIYEIGGIFRSRKKDLFGIWYDYSFTDELIIECDDIRIRKIVEDAIKSYGESNFDRYIYWGEL